MKEQERLQKEEAKRAKELAEENIRLQRAQRVEEERQRQRASAGSSVSSKQPSPSESNIDDRLNKGVPTIIKDNRFVFGAALGAMVILAGNVGDDDIESSNATAISKPSGNGTVILDSVEVSFGDSIQEPTVSPALQEVEKQQFTSSSDDTTADKDSADITWQNGSSINPNSSPRRTPTNDMDQDDGGDDWLRMMGEIIREDEKNGFMAAEEKSSTEKVTGSDATMGESMSN